MAKAATQDHPRRGGRLRRRLLLAAALLAAAACAFFLGGIFSRQQSQPEITTDLIGRQLADIQELATVEYLYTNMGRFENQLDFYGWSVPLTRKSFIISYDGVIKAGIDLSGIDIEVAADRVTVTLPPAGILSHEIPEDSIEVFDETHNIFNPIEISDYTGFTRDQKTEMENRAVENGLLDQARQKARTAVERLLSLLPGMEQYTLTVK